MHKVVLDQISKVEGSAALEVTIDNGQVTSCKFQIKDYRRFYTQAVKGKPALTAPSFLSRICGTCSVAHLFASIEAVERSQDIQPSPQTLILRRLAYNALIIRDHALHLYFFSLPDVLGIDSILEIPDDPQDPNHQLLHDSFDIKRTGTDISNAIIGAAIHAPFPTPGGFLKTPDPQSFPKLISQLEKIRPQILRIIKLFADWDAKLVRNTDYLCLINKDSFDFIDGLVTNSNGKQVPEAEFHDFLQKVVIPYSQAEGYIFSDTHEDYLVGALARLNLNQAQLHPHTQSDTQEYLSKFPSDNIFHNNLAQAIEILHCVDNSLEILKNLQIKDEKPIRKPPQAGTGVGVVEAPRGILYHLITTDAKGIITDCDVIVPTAQNQINIENDLKQYFQNQISKQPPGLDTLNNPNKDPSPGVKEFENHLKHEAEKIIRAYDPCMSCATNFLKLKLKIL
jgi:coenzyme F420-reducing hydrogenase alpha subunit